MRVAWVSRLLCIAGLASLHSGWAQPPANGKETNGSAAPPLYEDRLIDSGNLAPLPGDDRDDAYNGQGWPRAWRIEAFTSNFDQGGVITRENGLTLNGRLDTPEYGGLSVDGILRTRPNSSIFTLWQRGLPFDNGWRANNGAGMLNTFGIDLSRSQYRFYLPTFPIAGVATEWTHSGAAQLQASLGEPGLYNGLRLSGFSRLGGNVFTTGGQWAIAPDAMAGFQFADAQRVRNNILDSLDPGAKISARSWYGGTAWRDGNTRLQFNFVDSEADQSRHKLGYWLDAETRDGRYRHNYGAFRLDPDLLWGYAPITSDLQGGYYRINYQSQQWLWDLGIDKVSSVTGRGTDGLFSTGSIRYQVNRSLGLGGGASLRHSDNNGESAYAFVDKVSRFGTSRVQVDVVSEEHLRHGRQVTVDQSWPLSVGLRLSTSLSVGEERGIGEHITRSSFALFGGADLSNRLTFDGNVRWTASRDNGSRTNSTFANLSLNWRLNTHWSLSSTFYQNRTEEQPFLAVSPLIPVDNLAPVFRDRAVFLVLRYEDSAGTPLAPLGGPPGSGAGTIVGYLFFDANDDGRRDANETGAANVTIVLDGRFSARTDVQGRFEFPLVMAGKHILTVVPDNLPLPWMVSGDGKREISVSTRETTTIDIAASKLK